MQYRIYNSINNTIGLNVAEVSLLTSITDEISTIVQDKYPSSGMHTIDHAVDVANRAYQYAVLELLDGDPTFKLKSLSKITLLESVIVAGLIHDIFSNTNRDTHHILGAWYVRNDPVIDNICNNFDLPKDLIAHAIEHHRASTTTKHSDNWWYNHPVSHFIATADRRLNISEFYHKWKSLENQDDQYNLITHMVDKFGPNGYSQFPPYTYIYRNNELTKIQELCSSASNITKQFNQYIKEG